MGNMTQIGSVIAKPRPLEPRLNKVGMIRLGQRDANGRASECDHFILESQDVSIASKITQVYGPAPKSLEVTFHTDDISKVYTCENQLWGLSKQQKPFLMCAGDGATAKEFGKADRHPCPCPRLGKDCRQKTMLTVLLPRITMSGTFLLVTKSHYSTEIIHTTLAIAQRSGGMVMRPFKLVRTKGFATVNNMKVKKHFVALMLDDTAVKTSPTDCSSPKTYSQIAHPEQVIMSPSVVPAGLVIMDEESPLAKQQLLQRIKNGREKVKKKLTLYIRHPQAETALETYACRRFGKHTFEDLSREELLVLWHDIGVEDSVVGDIVELLK